MRKKERSAAQQLQQDKMRRRQRNKENDIPRTSTLSVRPLPARGRLPLKVVAKLKPDYERLYRNERRKRQRLVVKDEKHTVEIKRLKAELGTALISAAHNARLAVRAKEDSNALSSHLTSEVKKHSEQITLLRTTARALKARCDRHPAILKRAIQKTRLCPRIVKLTRRGAYTPEARALARIVVKAGCSQAQVGGLIKNVGKLLGITVRNPMSRRTVSRAILEGGIAAKIQLGYEMSRTESQFIYFAQCIKDDLRTHQ